MAVISGVGVEVAWAILTLVYGILVEKYYVSQWSAIPNLAGYFIILATIDLPLQAAYVILGVYSSLGLYVAYKHATPLYFLISSKVYGALMLVLGLNQFGLLDGIGNWAQANVYIWFGTDAGKIVFSWFLVAVASQILCLALADHLNLTQIMQHGL
jgi:hypothetical protein